MCKNTLSMSKTIYIIFRKRNKKKPMEIIMRIKLYPIRKVHSSWGWPKTADWTGKSIMAQREKRQREQKNYQSGRRQKNAEETGEP